MQNNNDFFVSIITPNYNGEKYLEETIVSVISQTNKNFEFLIFDGNSNDKSHEIINKFKDKIDHLSIEKDINHYHAVDKAIKICNGNIILWINSDDVLHKDAVSNIIKIFKADESIEWISGKNGYIKNGKKIIGIPYIYPNIIIKKGLAHHNYWGFIQQETTVFKKKLFQKSGGFKKKYGNASDYHLWINFSSFAKLKSYNIELGYFRTWAGQNSKVQEKNYFEDTGYKKNLISFRFLRILFSILCLPYVYFKTKKLKKN